ncbi:hypothetical protein [Bifidobacterium sp. SO4]|uniref:hypothetical protein n=1 Tax=Bifidobacterium sp. SO4 TaxID=2809030 RepID=UPI001BDC0F12|nr:hypothetical protein [Bifidobacterium sp. SO4]MBT1170582.1 hypothetical protein [Bifidobacterium sp. SO4]
MTIDTEKRNLRLYRIYLIIILSYFIVVYLLYIKYSNFIASTSVAVFKIVDLLLIILIIVLELMYKIYDYDFVIPFLFLVQFNIGMYLLKYYPYIYENNAVLGRIAGGVQCLLAFCSVITLIITDGKAAWVKGMAFYSVVWMLLPILMSIVDRAIEPVEVRLPIVSKSISESDAEKVWKMILSDVLIGVLLLEQALEFFKIIFLKINSWINSFVNYCCSRS